MKSLNVDWQALREGDMATVNAVKRAWSAAAMHDHLYGHIWPYKDFYVFLEGRWEHAVHLNRWRILLLRQARQHSTKNLGYSWRHHQSRPRFNVSAQNSE